MRPNATIWRTNSLGKLVKGMGPSSGSQQAARGSCKESSDGRTPTFATPLLLGAAVSSDSHTPDLADTGAVLQDGRR